MYCPRVIARKKWRVKNIKYPYDLRPEQTLKRMCKQVTGIDRPTELAITQALEWLDRGLLLYEKVGKAGVEG